MIKIPKEGDNIPLKLEGHSSEDHEKAKPPSLSTSPSQWSRLKDPRIVRVSRAFGGKDRHSKVCTIRGLRDRRVRLSVPTAIQLYDLQDRLGLNQPSKVVDWLLNAAKHEIDELPPLPNFNPPGNFTFSGYPSSLITPHHEANTTSETNELLQFHERVGTSVKDQKRSNEQHFNMNRRSNVHQWEGSSQNSMWKLKAKEVSEENWMSRSEEGKQRSSNNEGGSAHVLPNNLQRPNHYPSFLGLLNTMPLGYNQWENSGSDVNSQLGNHGFSNQTDHMQSINVAPFPSTLSLSTGNSQILVCPPGATPTQFPSHITAMEMDQRQINHYQMLSLSSQNLFMNNSLNNPSFSLAMMTPRLLHSPNSNENPSSHRDQDFTSK